MLHVMKVKKIARKVISKVVPFLRYMPFWDKLVINNCQIYQPKKNLLGRLVNALFNQEYYTRPYFRRLQMLTALNFGAAGAEYYDKTRAEYPPKKGEKVGNLDWHKACPALKRVTKLISKYPKTFCTIQLGASSGKEISYLANIFPDSNFIYTDIDESATDYASKQAILPNLSYVTCPAESIPALAQTVKYERIIIFSSGSAQYVYPESIDTIFRQLSKIKNKKIDFILDEPGYNLSIDPFSFNGSFPSGHFSYTHNYQFYAEKYGFNINNWDLIQPYVPQKDFFPHHQGTFISLAGLISHEAF
jgi:hypothetical protein